MGALGVRDQSLEEAARWREKKDGCRRASESRAQDWVVGSSVWGRPGSGGGVPSTSDVGDAGAGIEGP